MADIDVGKARKVVPQTCRITQDHLAPTGRTRFALQPHCRLPTTGLLYAFDLKE
jgi:hypothetical protein